MSNKDLKFENCLMIGDSATLRYQPVEMSILLLRVWCRYTDKDA